MKTAVQGETITFSTTFYNVEPAQGGVPTDTDYFEHALEISNDDQSRVSDLSVLESGDFPITLPLYFAIIDSGSDFNVKAYTTADNRTNDVNGIMQTGTLAYGVFVDQALAEMNGSGFTGTISLTFPGIGAGQEDFEADDAGQADPTYTIHNEDNTEVVASTVFPTRLDVGKYETSYDVPEDAVAGENWRLTARGKIDGADTFVTEYFRVVDAAVAEEEAARLVTLSEVKSFLNITTSDEDTDLLADISAASGIVEDFTGVQYHITDEVGYFSGSESDRIHFKDGPIYDVTKVERRYGYETWQTIELRYFNWNSWFLMRIDENTFDEGVRNWRVTYQRGLDRAPRNVRRAILLLIQHWYVTHDRTGVESDVVGGGLRVKYSIEANNLPPKVLAILKPLQRRM